MVGLLAQHRLLAALHHQTQGGLVEAVQRFAGLGGTEQGQAGNSRGLGAVLSGESFNELHQLPLLANGHIGLLVSRKGKCIHGSDPR
ncbi:hypothetical protein D3C81_2109420 [compost metagenome]